MFIQIESSTGDAKGLINISQVAFLKPEPLEPFRAMVLTVNGETLFTTQPYAFFEKQLTT